MRWTGRPDGAVDDGTTIPEYLRQYREQLVEQLTGWLRLRSLAGLPEHEIDLARSANWLAATLRDAGFPTVEVWRAPGAPAVYAEWCAAPGAPKVLVYSHHDVRAAKDDEWEQTPFEPALRDGYLYGRGASDAKGQVLATSGPSGRTRPPPADRHRRST
jgi:acetylornithine deacetylase/succinyl-diaminopimelate desuccinylase-like protein